MALCPKPIDCAGWTDRALRSEARSSPPCVDRDCASRSPSEEPTAAERGLRDGWETPALAARTAPNDLSSLLADALRAEIGDSKYDLWFDGHTTLSANRDGVTVGVANQYFRGWFETEFGREIARAAAKSVGKKVPVRYAVSTADESNHNAEAPAKAVARKRASDAAAPVKSPPRKTTETPKRSEPIPQPPKRPSRFQLSQFVVGAPNRVAHAAAVALVEHPAQSASPLYICGGIGVGKTHLLRGVEDGLRRRTQLRIACYNCEEFANEFIEAYKTSKLPAFRRRIRSLDVLLIDDVQFLAGKKATQEELVHAMEAIQHRGGKVIFTGDAHPRRLSKLQEELRSRFIAGMAAKLDPPTRDMRRHLVAAKAAERGLHLSDDVVHFIADQVKNGVREIEGATIYLSHALKRGEERATVAEVRSLLADHLRHAEATLDLPSALAKAAELFRIPKAKLNDRSRSKGVSEPRGLIIYLLRRYTGAAYGEIGRALGGFNHSTVIAAEKRVRRKLLNDGSVLIGDRRWKLQDAVDAFEREVGSAE